MLDKLNLSRSKHMSYLNPFSGVEIVLSSYCDFFINGFYSLNENAIISKKLQTDSVGILMIKVKLVWIANL